MILYYDTHFDIFRNRPNRFIAHIDIDGKEVISHVPNTGRLRELLVPDASVMLSHHPSKHRKTLFVVQFEQAAGFSPNKLMDPGFAEKVEEAKHVGVEVLSYRCVVKPDEVKITDKIPVIL